MGFNLGFKGLTCAERSSDCQPTVNKYQDDLCQWLYAVIPLRIFSISYKDIQHYIKRFKDEGSSMGQLTFVIRVVIALDIIMQPICTLYSTI